MATYNGLISSLIKGQSGGAVLTGASYANIVSAVPRGYFHAAKFGAIVSGISGGVDISVVASIGGCTYVVAGKSFATNGSHLFGATTSVVDSPRPAYVQYKSTKNTAGFTASVFMSGEYN
jgi:hypothetical protein